MQVSPSGEIVLDSGGQKTVRLPGSISVLGNSAYLAGY